MTEGTWFFKADYWKAYGATTISFRLMPISAIVPFGDFRFNLWSDKKTLFISESCYTIDSFGFLKETSRDHLGLLCL